MSENGTATKLFMLLMLSILSAVVHVNGIFKFLSVCDKRRGLTEEQVKTCYNFPEHMLYILDGSKLALNECKQQFAGRKWNCTFPHQNIKPFLHPPMPLATQESGFVHAIVSAGTMHAMSRACMESKLSSYCACSEEGRPDNLESQHVWAGCGDNLPYGFRFSKQFMDASEVINENRLESFETALMNLHNNEVGRWAVYEESIIQCRCHGASTTCATKMCYRQLGNFKKVGKYLEKAYQRSIKVKLSQSGEKENMEIKLMEYDSTSTKYTSKDLIYLENSPSYCRKDLTVGSFGTVGRKCQIGGDSLNDCSILCCDRGHTTKRQVVKEKCGCKFFWCCEVRCQTCEKEQNVHHCR